MSLGEELRNIDEATVVELFVDIWGVQKIDPSAVGDFVGEERDATYENYPALNAIRLSLVAIAPKLIENGTTKEEVANMMMGMTMMATVLAAYASSEVPETPEGI